MAAAVAESLGTTPPQSVCASGKSADGCATAAGTATPATMACDASAVGERALANIEFAHALDSDSDDDDSNEDDDE